MSLALSKQKTLSRYVEVEVWKHRELAELQPVMKGIESACRGIATLVRRAQCDEIAGLHGSGGDTNVQGEVQKVGGWMGSDEAGDRPKKKLLGVL